MFKGEAVYHLPFGRGALFLNNSTLLDEVLGGWQLSSTFMAQGGNPMGVTTGGLNDSYNRSGSYTQYANLTGNYKGADPITGNKYHSITEWYNTNAFTLPAPGTYGTFRRNIIDGPGMTDVNFSLGKSFDLWPERGVKLQIRSDASNVLNHPSWAQSGDNVVGCAANNLSGCTSNISGTTVGGRAIQLYGRVSF
jgi:hypothetical protein